MVWDYEGKLEAKAWDKETKNLVITARSQSPPAKMIRTLVFYCGEQLLTLNGETLTDKWGPQPLMGKTVDVPYVSPLENRLGVRSQVSTTDATEVDLA